MVGRKKLCGAGAILLLAMLAGCSYPGDTSGFKAEKTPSKAELQQQIDQVKSNEKIPANAKAMALKRLEDELAKAH